MLTEAQTGQGEADASIRNHSHRADFPGSFPCQKGLFYHKTLGCEIDNCVYARFAALSSELAADFLVVDRVHDNDMIGAVVAQE